MKVTEGASFELSDGTWQKPDIQMEEVDFERIVSEWGLTQAQADAIPMQTRYELLSAWARQLLVIRQIKARIRDTHWVQETGSKMYEEVAKELNEIRARVGAA